MFPHFSYKLFFLILLFLSSTHFLSTLGLPLIFLFWLKPSNFSVMAKTLSFSISHLWLTLFSLSFTSSPLFCNKACSAFSVFFILKWYSYIYIGDNGASVYVSPFFSSIHLFLKPSCLAFLPNYQGLPNNRSVTCIGTTSHKTSSLYLPTKNDIKTCLVTLIAPYLFNHWGLYSIACLVVVKFNF